MAKKFISATYKSKKITLPDETVNFCPKEVIFRDSFIAKMNFLAVDKFDFVQDKTYFIWTDGMGIRDKNFVQGQ